MVTPIIPWMGGKRRLADRIFPRFPDHSCYIEPFAGGAALFFLRQPAEVEVLNDINGELVNLYRVVQNHLEEFVRQFKWTLSSRQMFEWHKTTRPETLTDIQHAARFYYLQQNAFGSRIAGQSFGTATTASPGLNLLLICDCPAPTSSTCHGSSALSATTVRTRCSIWIRPTGRQKAMAWSLVHTSTKRWPAC